MNGPLTLYTKNKSYRCDTQYAHIYSIGPCYRRFTSIIRQSRAPPRRILCSSSSSGPMPAASCRKRCRVYTVGLHRQWILVPLRRSANMESRISTKQEGKSRSYGNMRFSVTCPAETPQLIKMKFCTIWLRRRGYTRRAKMVGISWLEMAPQIGEI
jgi:hypothetical protein